MSTLILLKMLITASLNFKTPFSARERWRNDLPLFDGSPKVLDIIQGDYGTCWFLCGLASYLRPGKSLETRSQHIKELFKEYALDDGRDVIKVKMNKEYVVVDRWINQSTKQIRSKCSWPMILEKVMMSIKTVSAHKYSKKMILNDPDGAWYCDDIVPSTAEIRTGAQGLSIFMSSPSKWMSVHLPTSRRRDHSPPHVMCHELFRLVAQGEHVVANSVSKEYGGRSLAARGAIPRHCYAILGCDYDSAKKAYSILLYNPWGSHSIRSEVWPPGVDFERGMFRLSWKEFYEIFGYIHSTTRDDEMINSGGVDVDINDECCIHDCEDGCESQKREVEP